MIYLKVELTLTEAQTLRKLQIYHMILRRPSYTYEDMFYAFILGMDTFALGLIKAAELIEDGRIDKFIEEKYSSFDKGIGKKIVDGKTTLEELSEYAEKLGNAELPGSGRQEYLESVLNNVLFRG